MREGSFKVTRMRCWRISSVEPVPAEAGGAGPSSAAAGVPGAAQLELSFEYLMSRDQLQWVRLASPQAVLMSVCLQALVEELLRRRKGLGIPRVSTVRRRKGLGIPRVSTVRRRKGLGIPRVSTGCPKKMYLI